MRLSKNSRWCVLRRIPSSADDGIKLKSVISGDMCLGNDTSRDGQGDFSQESSPGRHAAPLSEKANGLFRQALPRSQRGTGHSLPIKVPFSALRRIPSPEGNGIKSNPSFPGTCASERTLLSGQACAHSACDADRCISSHKCLHL